MEVPHETIPQTHHETNVYVVHPKHQQDQAPQPVCARTMTAIESQCLPTRDHLACRFLSHEDRSRLPHNANALQGCPVMCTRSPERHANPASQMRFLRPFPPNQRPQKSPDRQRTPHHTTDPFQRWSAKRVHACSKQSLANSQKPSPKVIDTPTCTPRAPDRASPHNEAKISRETNHRSVFERMRTRKFRILVQFMPSRDFPPHPRVYAQRSASGTRKMWNNYTLSISELRKIT